MLDNFRAEVRLMGYSTMLTQIGFLRNRYDARLTSACEMFPRERLPFFSLYRVVEGALTSYLLIVVIGSLPKSVDFPLPPVAVQLIFADSELLPPVTHSKE